MKTRQVLVVGVASATVAWTGWLTAAQTQRPPVSVSACVGADAIIRIAKADGSCDARQTPVKLDLGAPGTLGPNDAPSDDTSVPTNSPGLEGKVADLERRVAELEKTPLFEVVDRERHVIFSVGPQKVSVYNANQSLVASISAASGSGTLTAWSDNSALETSVGVYGTRAGLWISENGRERVDAGRRPAGNYALRILTIGGAALAGIGGSTNGTGSVVVNDDRGQLRALLGFEDGRGTIVNFSSSGAGLVSLKESTTGAGLFELGDKGGDPTVKMTVNDNRYGAVLAGPVAGLPLVPASGLPGSYFLGCAGGPSCIR
jgi:hypothetical protein